MAEKILALFKEYENLRKINPDRRENHPLIKEFKDKLGTTMQFWPRNALAKMEQSPVKKRPLEIAAINHFPPGSGYSRALSKCHSKNFTAASTESVISRECFAASLRKPYVNSNEIYCC